MRRPARNDVTTSRDVARVGGREHLHQFGNDRAGQRAAGDDRRQLPPHRGIAPQVRDQQAAGGIGQTDGDERGQPDQAGQRLLVIHLRRSGVPRCRDGLVDEVREAGGEHHDDAHREDPDQQLDLDRRVGHGQHDEHDQRHARDAVGLEAVGARADRVAGVVADAVSDHAWIAGVVFLDLEDDLHQIRADVGDLGEDAAGDAERRGAERLADGEADEARPRHSRAA